MAEVYKKLHQTCHANDFEKSPAKPFYVRLSGKFPDMNPETALSNLSLLKLMEAKSLIL